MIKGIGAIQRLYRRPITKIFDRTFILAKDMERVWTNGYMADLGGMNFDLIETTAKLLEIKGKMNRYCVTDDKKIEIIKILPKETGVEAIKVTTDFESNELICLSSEELNVWVNGAYIAHFASTYIGCKFMLISPLKPIVVISDDKTVGLVMPIRKME